MRTTFNRLFAYNYDMNLKIAKAILENPSAPPDCNRFMSHILNAQEIWLGRLAPEMDKAMNVWDMHPLEEIEAKLAQDNENWVNYLKNIEEEDFLKIISYKNSKGDPFTNRTMDILYHVINHSTHHRGQISLLLRQTGIAPPITDYIFYLREKH